MGGIFGEVVQSQSYLHQTQHPKILWYVGILAGLLSFPFGIINSLLILYLEHVMHFNAHQKYAFFSAYNAIVFILPLIGGYTAGQFGYKKSLIFSTLLCVIGPVLLMFSSECVLLRFLLVPSLAIFATGVSFFVPIYLVLVGKFYHRDDPRRESGYTWVYVLSNLGFLLAAFCGGYLQSYISYGAAFGFGAFFMLIAFFTYPWMISKIKDYENKTISAKAKISNFSQWICVILVSLMMILAGGIFLFYSNTINFILLVLVGLEIIGVFIMALIQPRAEDRRKLIAFLILSVTSMGFWSLYILEPSLLTVFIQDHVNRSFFSWTLPPSVLYGLDPLFVVLLGSFLGVLWVKLQKKNKNPSLPAKFSLSLFSMTLGMSLFLLSILFAGMNNQVNLIWIILGYLFLTIGELLISPIGQSMVGKLAPLGQEGLMMGIWQTFVGFSAAFADRFADMADIPSKATYEQGSHVYFHAFITITLVTFLLALASWSLVPVIKKAIVSDYSDRV